MVINESSYSCFSFAGRSAVLAHHDSIPLMLSHPLCFVKLSINVSNGVMSVNEFQSAYLFIQ